MTSLMFLSLVCCAAAAAFLIGLAFASVLFARPRQISLGHFGERHDD